MTLLHSLEGEREKEKEEIFMTQTENVIFDSISKLINYLP